MSKMDDLRAMREARYEQMTARAGKPAAAPPKRQPQAPTPAGAQHREAQPVEAQPVKDRTVPPEASACGHRAISGRTCTREQGHAAKSHRYS